MYYMKSYYLAECAAGYYGNQTNCTACSGIRAKSSQGDARDCDTECDPTKSSPNPEHTDCGKSYSKENFPKFLLLLTKKRLM